MFSQFCVSHSQHHARLPWWNANTSSLTKTRLNLRHSCSNLINCAHTERILHNRNFPFPILEVTVSSAVLYVLQWSFECIINLPLWLCYHNVWHCTSSTKHIHPLCCLSNELQRILFVYYGVYISLLEGELRRQSRERKKKLTMFFKFIIHLASSRKIAISLREQQRASSDSSHILACVSMQTSIKFRCFRRLFAFALLLASLLVFRWYDSDSTKIE